MPLIALCPPLLFYPSCLCSTLWRYLFGRQARDLEQSNTAEDEYMISDTGGWELLGCMLWSNVYVGHCWTGAVEQPLRPVHAFRHR